MIDVAALRQEAVLPGTTGERLRQIVAQAPVLTGVVARHSNMSTRHMCRAVLKLSRWERIEAMRQPDLPVPLLQALADADDVEALRQLATSPACDEATLLKLLDHEDETVTIEVLYRQQLSPCLLAKAARDDRSRVRLQVALHLDAAPEVIANLATDRDSAVRVTAIRHSHATLAQRIAAASDGDAELRLAAVTSTSSFETDNTLTPPSDRLCLADMLLARARDDDPSVRQVVALHPNACSEALMVLTRDPVARVRRTLAQRPDMPKTVEATLAGDCDPLVRSALEYRRSRPA